MSKRSSDETATTATTTTDAAAAKRESAPRGPRSRYWLCAAIKGKEVVHSFVESANEEQAKATFKEETGLVAKVCDGGEGAGYYVAKGTGISDAQRISVTVDAKQLHMRTSSAFQGEFRGWNVYASGLKACNVNGVDYADNDLVSIEFADRADPASKVAKPKLKKREVVRLADLSNVSSL